MKTKEQKIEEIEALVANGNEEEILDYFGDFVGTFILTEHFLEFAEEWHPTMNKDLGKE